MHTSPEQRRQQADSASKAKAEFERETHASYENKPDRQAGEKYWKQYGMARRIKNSDGVTHLAEPGESAESGETDGPYSIWSTAAFGKDGGELKDFGIGIGLYFQTLLLLGTVTMLCFFIILPSLIDFRADGYLEYSGGQDGWDVVGNQIGFLQKGSMACTGNITLFMSRTYGEAPLEGPRDDGSLSLGWNSVQEKMGIYVKNTCLIDAKNGYLTLGAAGLFSVVIMLFGIFVDMSEEAMDEAVQTAQDYSVVVLDPPKDATNCDEWKEFFEQFGPVAAVTVAINNKKLLTALGHERSLRKNARRDGVADFHQDHGGKSLENDMAGKGSMRLPSSDAKKKGGGVLSVVGLTHDKDYYKKELEKSKREVAAAIGTDVKYEVQRVFVTFDTETAQRDCMTQCQVGFIPAFLNCSDCIGNHPKFRDEVLSVREAVEPSEVIWENLGTSYLTRVGTVCFTALVTVGLVALCSYLINQLWKATESPVVVALGISCCNTVLPMAMKVLNTIEIHVDYGDGMQSLLLKLLCARLYTSVFILQIFLIPFDKTLTEDTMSKIVSLLLSEAVFNPIIQLSDASTLGTQLLLGPLSATQAKMNTYYEGTKWYLSERYTNMIKTIFMTFFWCSLVPQAMLLCSLALFANYWVDKYLLLRKWQRVPQIDASLAKDSKFYLLVCVLFHFVMTTRFYSSFSFDNVCAVDVACVQATGSNANVESCYLRDADSLYNAYRQDELHTKWGTNATWVAMPTRLVGSTLEQIDALKIEALNIEAATNYSSRTFMYGDNPAAWVWCDRNQEEFYNYIWPDTKKWMSEGQEDLVRIYRVINVAVGGIMFFWFFARRLLLFLKGLIVGNYSPVGDAQPKRYSEVEDINAYIPSYTQPGILNPYIACDIDTELFGKYLTFESSDYDAHSALLPRKGSHNTWHFKDLYKTNDIRQKKGWPLFSPMKLYIDDCEKIARDGPVNLDDLELRLDLCRKDSLSVQEQEDLMYDFEQGLEQSPVQIAIGHMVESHLGGIAVVDADAAAALSIQSRFRGNMVRGSSSSNGATSSAF
jgi:hypothetical protein